ncbi:glycosyltransferase family 4 protein [Janibacter sp. CX7]|uniref:glycosyltransferase family 4 protein n=1 Tax=Janibacter sp. CX7 TaxID=2963431 RepID=UPI0020CDE668|nr:glycosyltransferase family 4 protein [Janibacter sp. CX7]UTT65365.1 glycosyltransferase family 4 protein [Janibacter sp. CX7]
MGKGRPRRVALVASSFHPHTGGVETHVRQVARELASAGTAVEVWTVDRGEHLGTTTVDGITVRYLPTPLPARRLSSLVRLAGTLPRAALRWREASASFEPDVLHVQCFGPNGVYALALHRLTGTPLVVTSHGETFADDHGVYDRSALLRKALRAAIVRAQTVTAPTEFVLEGLRARFGLDGGVVVPNGIERQAPPAEAVELPAGRPLVVAVGRVERMKGFDLLLDVLTQPGLEHVHVAIGGTGSQITALREQARAAGTADRVHLLGELSPGQVAAAMAAADAVVVPSRHEAFGIVALEAWRAGTPLIGTVNGGMPEFVTDGVDGLLIDPREPDALAAVLSRVLVDRELTRRLTAAGKGAAQRLTWGQVTRQYVHLYESARSDRTGRPDH